MAKEDPAALNLKTHTYIAPDELSGNVAFYPAKPRSHLNNTTNPDSAAFVASGFGSQLDERGGSHDPFQLVYSFNPHNPHGYQNEELGIDFDAQKYVAGKDGPDDRHDSAQLGNRFFRLKVARDTPGYLSERAGKAQKIDGEDRTVADATGLFVFHGAKGIEHIDAVQADYPVHRTDEAKLFVAGMDKAAEIYVTSYVNRTQGSRTDSIAEQQTESGPSLKNVFLDTKKHSAAMMDAANSATGTAMRMRDIEIGFHENSLGSGGPINTLEDLVTERINLIARRFPQSTGANSAVIDVEKGLNPTLKMDKIRGPVLFERPLELRLSSSREYNAAHAHKDDKDFRYISQWVLSTPETDPYDPAFTVHKTIAQGPLTVEGLTSLLTALGREKFQNDPLKTGPDYSQSPSGQLQEAMIKASLNAILQAEKDLGIEGLGALREKEAHKSGPAKRAKPLNAPKSDHLHAAAQAGIAVVKAMEAEKGAPSSIPRPGTGHMRF